MCVRDPDIDNRERRAETEKSMQLERLNQKLAPLMMGRVPVVRTTPVRFTTGSIGLVSADDPYHFIEHTAEVGDHGQLIVQGDLPFSVPEGYVLVRVGSFYAPVDPSMIEAL